MAKRVIRMTESDLHNIVKESVNKILTELDWKTYQNAAKKAHEKGLGAVSNGNHDIDTFNKYSGKQYAFQRAAEKAFDREHGINNGRYYSKFDSNMYGEPSNVSDVSRIRLYDRQDQCPVGDTPLDLHYDFDRHRVADHNVVDAYDKAEEELGDYKRGNYDYQKGKGWQLKK